MKSEIKEDTDTEQPQLDDEDAERADQKALMDPKSSHRSSQPSQKSCDSPSQVIQMPFEAESDENLAFINDSEDYEVDKTLPSMERQIDVSHLTSQESFDPEREAFYIIAMLKTTQ